MWVWGVDIRGKIFLVWAQECVAIGIWSSELERTEYKGINSDQKLFGPSQTQLHSSHSLVTLLVKVNDTSFISD